MIQRRQDIATQQPPKRRAVRRCPTRFNRLITYVITRGKALITQLRLLAENEQCGLVQLSKADPLIRICSIIEAIRVIDFGSYVTAYAPAPPHSVAVDQAYIRWGCRVLMTSLLTDLLVPGIPIMESTQDTRDVAFAQLHQLGRSSLLNRIADMCDKGLATATTNGNDSSIRVEITPAATALLIDIDQTIRFGKIAKAWDSNRGRSVDGWDHIDSASNFDWSTIGHHFFSRNDEELQPFINPNIAERMASLVKRWDSGYGVMVGYDAAPDVDDHFTAITAKLVREWTEEAGLHPDASIDGIKGAELLHAIGYVVFLHVKHVALVDCAKQLFHDVVVEQSLTIWEKKGQLVQSFSDLSEIPLERARPLIDAISFTAQDAELLRDSATPLMPLLLDLGNDYVIRPISGIYGNPVQQIITTLCARSDRALNELMKRREDWMRMDLYYLFQGNKYQRIEGNIKLRQDGRLITDIDGAVLDVVTGDLALFQFKWQDFFTNDIKRLRSKAKNLISEMDAWSTAVGLWLSTRTNRQIAQLLRINTRRTSIRRIFLFGVSRNAAQMQGYGYSPSVHSLALSTWQHFARVRYEEGPGGDVIARLHERLFNEMTYDVGAKPIPVTYSYSGVEVHFSNLWNSIGGDDISVEAAADWTDGSKV